MPTAHAGYCAGDSVVPSVWIQLLNVLLFFAFLVRLRRLQRSGAKRDDAALWTAADYTVIVTGLRKRVHGASSSHHHAGVGGRW